MLRVTHYIFLMMVCWALAACLEPTDCSREEVFCAALVTDSQGLDDHGINADAWLGLQEAQESGLADKVDYIESVDSRDYLKNIAYFADRGYDVIFTSGIALADETLQSADLFADSVFVGLSQPFEESRPNLVSVTFPEDQMGFAAGLLAARISSTGIVAGICETSGIDSMQRYCEGFQAGAEYIPEADIEALIVYREDGDSETLFLDDARGYETATSLAGRGADVIFAAGGRTGQGAPRAASDLGILSIGAERDPGGGVGRIRLECGDLFLWGCQARGPGGDALPEGGGGAGGAERSNPVFAAWVGFSSKPGGRGGYGAENARKWGDSYECHALIILALRRLAQRVEKIYTCIVVRLR
ncbi:MAG: BMP family ABC transporter substrate-binding protein [Chloroflexi bacterium]|nr:BMP family ABC transporter substrate-binding protein [Chloroflexota bacterium]